MRAQQFSHGRRVERVHLAQPLIGRLGSAQVVLVDISMIGARVEHYQPIHANGHAKLVFRWGDSEITAECRVVRSRLERFSVGADGLTIYHSGVEFEGLSPEAGEAILRLIEAFITRALEEQKLNAYGAIPEHDQESMPIFRHGGQITANAKDVSDAVGSAALPALRVAKESGYVRYSLDHRRWRKKRTSDPAQPREGFTISALEDPAQSELLCQAYESSDREGRRLIRLFAKLSITDGEGGSSGRFEP